MLEKKGVRTERGTGDDLKSRRVVNLIKFKDPAGVRLEAFYGPQIQAASSRSSGGPNARFNTGDLGLGHIVLNVTDLEESVAFYRDVLGMRICDLLLETVDGIRQAIATENMRRRAV